MKHQFIRWIEETYFYNPSFLANLLSIMLLPLTMLYCIIVAIKRLGAKEQTFDVYVISIGNLIVGGSGKTPLTIALAKNYPNCAVLLRGYGRQSKGLYVISHQGKILENVYVSGDEAMLLAKSLPNATIIVSEDRKQAIQKAKELGITIIFLDDGFNKHDIRKYNILIRPKNEPKNVFCLPSGPYRESKFMYSLADLILKEDVDFIRQVSFKQNGLDIGYLPHQAVCVTAIANPSRLLEFLPPNTKMITFADHHIFTDDEIEEIFELHQGACFVTTGKDLVKLEKYANKFILLDLELKLQKQITFPHINHYTKG